MAVTARSCERARGWVSLALDDELSEFEGALLRAHTTACAECSAFQADAMAMTGTLRRAQLEPLPFPVRVPNRRRHSGQLLVRASTAAAALIVVLGGASELVRDHKSPASRGPLTTPVRRASAKDVIADRLNWPGGLPRVKPSELPVPLGQRQVDQSEL